MAEWPVPTGGLLRAAYKDRDRWKAEWQAAGFETEDQRARADRWQRKAEDMDRGVGL